MDLMLEEEQPQQLCELLQTARPDWRRKDIEAVHAKLERIGISGVPQLLAALRDKTLNKALERSGQKRFAAGTLRALLDAAEETPRSETSKCRANEPRGRRRRGRRGVEKAEVLEVPHGGRELPELPQEQCERSEDRFGIGLDCGEGAPFSHSADALPKTTTWSQRLEVLLEPDLREELFRRCSQFAVAPPPGATVSEIAKFLEAVVSWHGMNRTDLVKISRRWGLEPFYDETKEELLQRLKEQTWVPWKIPAESFTHLEVAYNLLAYFDKLGTLPFHEIITLCQQTGVPIEPGVRRDVLLDRLKLVAIWEQLPTPELEAECWRRLQYFDGPIVDINPGGYTGMFSFVDSMARDRQLREELLRQLMQEMHHEALAASVHQPCETDSGADDEFTASAQDWDEDEPFVCPECGLLTRTDGEPARIDGHRCCDQCALRIYYEEHAKALQQVQDREDQEVFVWLAKWRAQWRACREPAGQPAPQPPLLATEPESEPGREDSKDESETFHATAWPHTESEAETGCEERIVCKRLAQWKGKELEDDSLRAAAWGFIAELPTDASEGEETDAARAGPAECPQRERSLPLHSAAPERLCDVVQAKPEDLRRAASPHPEPVFAPAPQLQAQPEDLQRAASPHPEPLFAPAPQLQVAPAADTERADFPRAAPLRSPLRTCFCYSSPLYKGLPELNARAEWEAIQAEGIEVTVKTATANAVQDVLLSTTGPDILHISAHCATRGDSPCLILEGADGGARFVGASEFANLGWWGGIELLVLLACGSQALVQRLMQGHGLRRAVCCSTIILDSAAQIFCRTLYKALGAGKALRASFQAAQASICNWSSVGEAHKFVLLGRELHDSEPWVPCPQARPLAAPHEQFEWSQWPRVEDYIGREVVAIEIAKLFRRRRAVCLWGGEGSGKTALCTEFCHHFSAPGGRRFSAGAYHVSYERAAREAGGKSVAALLLPALLQGLCQSPLHKVWASRPAAIASQELLQQVAKQLDNAGSWLIVIDGLEEQPSEADHALLAELLETTKHLHVLLTARKPLPGDPWAKLGFAKVVDFPLPPLLPADAARLLALRSRRPLYHRDFNDVHAEAFASMQDHEPGVAPLQLSPELIQKLMLSPIMAYAEGSPGQILKAAAEVGQDLPSLLRHPFLDHSSEEPSSTDWVAGDGE